MVLIRVNKTEYKIPIEDLKSDYFSGFSDRDVIDVDKVYGRYMEYVFDYYASNSKRGKDLIIELITQGGKFNERLQYILHHSNYFGLDELMNICINIIIRHD